MFSEFPLVYILLFVFAIIAVASFFFKKYLKSRNLSEKGRANEILKFYLYIYFFMCFILWFSLPYTAALGSFGYPYGLEDIATNERILKLLQRYNKAIVRTTEVLFWFIFFTSIWLNSLFYAYDNALKNKEKE